MTTAPHLSPYLTCHQVSLAFGASTVFEDVSFSVHPGERVALIGKNGCGKSSLLNIITRKQSPQSGTVALRQGVQICHVLQEDDFDLNLTVQEVVFAALPENFKTEKRAAELEEKINELLAQGERDPNLYESDKWLNTMAKLTEEQSSLSGIGSDNLIQSLLKKALIEELKDRKISGLSGGQRKKLQIVAALVAQPQIILLDEPTNHLDIAGIDWLEDFLLSVVEQGTGFLGMRNPEENPEPFAFVIVSHDRSLLDTLCSKFVEIDKGKSFLYDGNYEEYLEQKLLRESSLEKTESTLRNQYRRELEWLKRGPAARTTKQTARIERAKKLKGTLQQVSFRAEKSAVAEIQFQAGTEADKSSFVPSSFTLGQQELIVCKSVSLAVGENSKKQTLFRNLNLTLKPRQRMAIVSPNGKGKTTLLKTLVRLQAPTEGEVLIHEQAKIGYLSQTRLEYPPNFTVKQVICDDGEQVYLEGKYIHVNGYLAKFDFSKFDAQRELQSLSGGEKARLLLAKLMLEHPNVLVLDEPTNDLDISTIQSLEQSLESFPGSVIFSSHDRYFVRKIATRYLVWDCTSKASWIECADMDQSLEILSKATSFERNNLEMENGVKNLSQRESGKSGNGSNSLNLESNSMNQSASKSSKVSTNSAGVASHTLAKQSLETLSFQEQKEWSLLERRLEEIEVLLSQKTDEISLQYAQVGNAQSAKTESAKLADQLKTLQLERDSKVLRWEQLFAKQNGLE